MAGMDPWDELTEAERDLLLLASEEAELWEVSLPLPGEQLDGTMRPPIGAEAGRKAAQRLAGMGLVGVFRETEPEGDLAPEALARIFASLDPWRPQAPRTQLLRMFLTSAGEDLYFGAGGAGTDSS